METATPSPAGPEPLTVGQLINFLAPSTRKRNSSPRWPPDAFAVAAAVLQRSGAYTHVVSEWPPPEFRTDPAKWISYIQKISQRWRASWTKRERPPKQVRGWWSTLASNLETPTAAVAGNGELCRALLQLAAAADEACEGIGIPAMNEPDDFEKHARERLRTASTLCELVDRSRASVLPKLHTPQSGMTLRSLSHNLALYDATDLKPSWDIVPMTTEALGLNLLLIPWPKVVTPGQFRECHPAAGNLLNMPGNFKFFHYDLDSSPKGLADRAYATYKKAEGVVGRIDGVVFPELSIEAGHYVALRDKILELKSFLVCGVGKTTSTAEEGEGLNRVYTAVPVSQETYVELRQNKHHRWRLDKNQIIQYGLGARLDPSCSWWERIPVGERELKFIAMQPWLTMCALVCEDLARQDPVADLLRSVGPNLVVAILMDGPQRSFRWPARYATVLADDPGSSVLTLTSVGMAELSRPPHSQTKSRTVALWKDAYTGDPVEIELPRGCDAVVLSLAVEYREEWAADGRGDGRVTGYPILAGIHYIDELPSSESVPRGKTS